MTEQPAPVPPPHESPAGKVRDWFAGHGEEIRAAGKGTELIAEELKPLLHSHAAGVLGLAQKVLSSPELKVIAPEVLDLAVTAASLAGITL